jgi:hypothetical protein
MTGSAIFAAMLGLMSPAMAFFIPLTTEQQVAYSDKIAVVYVTSVAADESSAQVVVIRPIKGVSGGERIRVATDSNIDGRDPRLKESSAYLIFLTKDERGKWVTPQSLFDAIPVNKGALKTNDGKLVPIDTKIREVMEIIRILKSTTP